MMATPAGGDRERVRERERAHLFKAALKVMARNNYTNANITDILTEAKVSTRAFYRHFASKDDLLLEMFQENSVQMREHLEQSLTAATTPLDRLLAWIDEMLFMGYDARMSSLARMFAAESLRATVQNAAQESVKQLVAPLVTVIEDGKASGAFPACGEPAQDAATVLAIVWRLFGDAMRGHSTLSRDEARAHALRYILPALGVSDHRA